MLHCNTLICLEEVANQEVYDYWTYCTASLWLTSMVMCRTATRSMAMCHTATRWFASKKGYIKKSITNEVLLCNTLIYLNGKWVLKMSLIWMSHVTRMNESCHTNEWVMSHVWISHVTQMNESCHTYEWVTAHIWMSHVTRMNASCRTYE